jgi:hypothetical protein
MDRGRARVALGGCLAAACSGDFMGPAGEPPPTGGGDSPRVETCGLCQAGSPSCSGGQPRFAAPLPLEAADLPGATASDVAVAWLDPDEQRDVAVFYRSPGGSGGVAAFANRGGRFELDGTREWPGSAPYRGIAADLDGDGVDELIAYALIAGDGESERAHILITRREPGGFAPVADVLLAGGRLAGGVPTAPLAAGDADGDGDLDVLAASYVEERGTVVQVLVDRGGGRFDSEQSLLGAAAATAVGFGDLDADGVVDAVAAFDDGESVRLFHRTSSGTWVERSACAGFDDPPTEITVGDFDCNGVADVRTLRESCYDDYCPNPPPPPDGGDCSDCPDAGEGNGDGDDDGGTVESVVFQTEMDPTIREVAADVTGDGRPELLVTGASVELDILLLDGGGQVIREVPASSLGVTLDFEPDSDDQTISLAAGDLSGDCTWDVVVGMTAPVFSDSLEDETPVASGPLAEVLISEPCGDGGGQDPDLEREDPVRESAWRCPARDPGAL